MTLPTTQTCWRGLASTIGVAAGSGAAGGLGVVALLAAEEHHGSAHQRLADVVLDATGHQDQHLVALQQHRVTARHDDVSGAQHRDDGRLAGQTQLGELLGDRG